MAEIHGRHKKACRKTNDSKMTKMKFNQINKEYEEVGSLAFLMDSKDKQKINELDARMENLKSELKSLFNDTKPDGLAGCKSNMNGYNSLSCSADEAPTFSGWLDKSIDEIDITSEEYSLPCSSTQFNDQSEKSSFIDKSNTENNAKFKFINPSIVSENAVEELLYKALYLQILGINLCSSELNAANHVKSDKKLKQGRVKCKKSLKKNNKENCNPSKISKYCQPSRIASRKSVEIIDHDHSSRTNNCTTDTIELKSSEETLDLDLTDYDWSEPFDLEDKEELSSDVEIIEDSCEENSEFGRGELKKKKLSSVNEYSSFSDKNSANGQVKSGWECPICLEPSKGQEVVATLCGHVFCKKCLQTCYSKSIKSCPTCRTDLTGRQLIPLYNF